MIKGERDAHTLWIFFEIISINYGFLSAFSAQIFLYAHIEQFEKRNDDLLPLIFS